MVANSITGEVTRAPAVGKAVLSGYVCDPIIDPAGTLSTASVREVVLLILVICGSRCVPINLSIFWAGWKAASMGYVTVNLACSAESAFAHTDTHTLLLFWGAIFGIAHMLILAIGFHVFHWSTLTHMRQRLVKFGRRKLKIG